MAQRRRRVSALLAPIEDAHARRVVLAGVAGLLITAPLSFQQALAARPVVGWMLTLAGAALAVGCARRSWCPPASLARAAAAACLVFCAVTAVLGIHQTVAALGLTDRQLICTDDIASETVGSGREIVTGTNPYVSFDLLTSEKAVGCQPLTVTPLRSPSVSILLGTPLLLQLHTLRAHQGAHDDHGDLSDATDFRRPAAA